MTAAGELHRRMRELPVAPLATLLKGRPALILAPHPDDESLGCGGLIAASCDATLPPIVVVVTDGTGSHPNSRQFPPPALRLLREAETHEAVAHLGLSPDRVVFLRLRDTAAPSHGPDFDAAVTAISAQLQHHGCGSICAPWRHDPHCDHEAAHLIAVEAAGQTGARLYSYPVWGWTLPRDTELNEPLPSGMRLDVSRHLSAKRSAIAAHASQHGHVVTDDPDGFSLPPNLLSVFEQPYEVFLSGSQ
jgi:LmbE family N-acetylglucosaminyl deacetylase